MFEVRVEIWNILVVSVVLMLVNACLNPGSALINTCLEDSNSNLTSTLGYTIQSIMSLVSVLGGLLAPWLRSLIGYRLAIALSAALHAALYVGMIVFQEVPIIIGAIVTGLGMGVIWVLVPNFVTVISKHENIERNLSYHMFIYNFNGITGNLLNYYYLEDSTLSITAHTRIKYYTVCTVVSVITGILGGLGIRNQDSILKRKTSIVQARECEEEMGDRLPSSDVGSGDTVKLLSDTDSSDTTETLTAINKSENDDVTNSRRDVITRFKALMCEPGARALAISNINLGMITTLIIIVPMCISNTYTDRQLIPLLGGMIGVTRMLFTGMFDFTARTLSYKAIVHLQTFSAGAYVITVLLVFPDNSLHNETPGDRPILDTGDWVVYLIGFLVGVTLTWLGVIVTIATGKVSRDKHVMHGFDSDVLFAYTMMVWSLSSAATFAITPYVSLYMYCTIALMGVICNHVAFVVDLLPFIGVVIPVTLPVPSGDEDSKSCIE